MNSTNEIRGTVRLIWTVLLGMAPLMLMAQGTRSVKGIVSDQNGKPLEGAVVQIENTRTLAIRSYITRNDGMYHFHGLDPNVDYELSATFQEKVSSSKTLSSFDERPVASIDLRIRLN